MLERLNDLGNDAIEETSEILAAIDEEDASADENDLSAEELRQRVPQQQRQG
ncbi:MAG: hypothetical protein PHD76_05365 [Methylacidiphilales bacterium]|nr:hypothetical protein [Candidatus Methylacidiphilales bacterium]